MSSRYQFEYVTFLVCPDHGTGCVRFRGDELVRDVTNVSWAGGELQVTTTSGAKRVQFRDDGTVGVEDVEFDPGRAVSRDGFTAVAHQVDAFFATSGHYISPETAARGE
jgi:hypothetical protein